MAHPPSPGISFALVAIAPSNRDGLISIAAIERVETSPDLPPPLPIRRFIRRGRERRNRAFDRLLHSVFAVRRRSIALPFLPTGVVVRAILT